MRTDAVAPLVVAMVRWGAFPPAADKEGEAIVSPGLAGFLVTFALALATVFLIRSMVKHLRKVRYGPGPDDPGPQPRRPQGPGSKDGPDAA